MADEMERMREQIEALQRQNDILSSTQPEERIKRKYTRKVVAVA